MTLQQEYKERMKVNEFTFTIITVTIGHWSSVTMMIEYARTSGTCQQSVATRLNEQYPCK